MRFAIFLDDSAFHCEHEAVGEEGRVCAVDITGIIAVLNLSVRFFSLDDCTFHCEPEAVGEEGRVCAADITGILAVLNLYVRFFSMASNSCVNNVGRAYSEAVGEEGRVCAVDITGIIAVLNLSVRFFSLDDCTFHCEPEAVGEEGRVCAADITGILAVLNLYVRFFSMASNSCVNNVGRAYSDANGVLGHHRLHHGPDLLGHELGRGMLQASGKSNPDALPKRARPR